MKLVLVTAVYNLRKSRPLSYYLLPSINLLKSLANSKIQILLFTNCEKSNFPKAQNIFIRNTPIEDLLSEIWTDNDWKSKYEEALKDRPEKKFEEKKIVELIGLWLGKFKMMEIALQRTSKQEDKILWQDAGVAMNLCNKNVGLYKPHKIRPQQYIDSSQKILKEKSLAFLQCERKMNLYHGVDMKKYGINDNLIRGGFILAKANEITKIKNGICKYWNILISNNDYGTEENPLTLYYHERKKDSVILSFNDWVSSLGLKKPNLKIL